MHLEQFESGKYERQYQYHSFLPEKIHHAWIISDSAIVELLGKADRAMGELNAFSQFVPDVDFYIQTYVAKEATQSSRIEGTQTNIEDAFKEPQYVLPEKHDDWQEVQNYIEAINFAVDSLYRLPLSNRLIKETHGILMQGVRGEHKQPGAFRTSQNQIGVSLRNAAFIPPHYDHVDELMSDMEKFLHDNSLRVPPLVKIAIAHYQFETIHPFLDGNGRLGRLMISLYLASEKLLSKPALYLSDYFERNKTAYIDYLMAVREGNHMDRWLVFFLHGVVETANSSIEVFKKIINLNTKVEQEILPRFNQQRLEKARTLIHHLYGRPIIHATSVAQLLETTPNTANALISELEKYGVLNEITGGRRNRLYIFSEYLALF